MKLAVGLFLVALLVRIVPWAAGLGDPAHVMQSPDCFGYERAAINLLDHHTLSLSKAPPIEPDTFRTPGYPLFIAGIFALAGRSTHAPVFVQIVLAALSCVLLSRWGRSVVGARAALWAGLAWALDIGAVANSGILLSESLCMALMMAAYVALAPALEAAGGPAERGGELPASRALAGGMLLGLAAMVRPAVLYFPAALALALFAARGKRAVRSFALVVLAFALPCGAWVARNAISVGVAEFSCVEGQVLLFYRTSGAMARVWGVPVSEAWKRLAEEADREIASRGWPRARHGQVCKELAGRYLAAHPLQHIPVLLGGAVKSWTGLSIYDILKHFGVEPRGLGLFERGLAGVPDRLRALTGLELSAIGLDLGMRLVVLALGAAGLVIFFRKRAWVALAVILPPLAYVTLTAGTVISYYRFRLPLVPFWSLAVGVAVEALVARLQRPKSFAGAPEPGV